MEKENLAIRISGVKKEYRLGNIGGRTLQADLQSWFARKRGREDPNVKIGQDERLVGQKFMALNGIDLTIRQGEMCGIIGSNGAGKSTLLKLLAQVTAPTEGEIDLYGRVTSMLEVGTGFNGEMTGRENIYMNGTILGMSKAEIRSKMEQIIEFSEVREFIDTPVKRYSSGMFVRLAFAVAINIDPEILIVDEALSVGDVFFQTKCYKKFEEFKEQGKTILFVSHDLSSISKYCDRVVLLNKGVKLAEGRPKEMVDMYKKVLVGQLDLEHVDEETENIAKAPSMEAAKSVKEAKCWKDLLSQNENAIEYGDKKAEIIDYAIVDSCGNITNTIEKGKPFTVRMKVQMHAPIEYPIFALSIKDAKGTEITGTNTMFEKTDFEVGPIMEISFEQDMNLQGGEYLLSLGCTGYNGTDFTVYHRLYDVCNITVVSDKNTVGYYDMNSKITVQTYEGTNICRK